MRTICVWLNESIFKISKAKQFSDSKTKSISKKRNTYINITRLRNMFDISLTLGIKKNIVLDLVIKYDNKRLHNRNNKLNITRMRRISI